jgi:hypothetical protein
MVAISDQDIVIGQKVRAVPAMKVRYFWPRIKSTAAPVTLMNASAIGKLFNGRLSQDPAGRVKAA